MLIFIDESGDPGIGSRNEVFVLALVKFGNASDVKPIDESISELKADLNFHEEFRFSSCPMPIKEKFFARIAKRNFEIKSIIVHKPSIRNSHLRTKPKNFYNYFLRRLLEFSNITSAKVVIDGQGQPKLVRSLKKYLNDHTDSQVRILQMKDSHRDNMLQLADMVAGAIARAYTTNPNKTDRWVKMLTLKKGEVWKFN